MEQYSEAKVDLCKQVNEVKGKLDLHQDQVRNINDDLSWNRLRVCPDSYLMGRYTLYFTHDAVQRKKINVSCQFYSALAIATNIFPYNLNTGLEFVSKQNFFVFINVKAHVNVLF